MRYTLLMEQDIQKLQSSVDSIAQTTAYILENITAKTDLLETEFNLQTQTNDLSVDLKSFKQETSENFREVNEKLDDISDTVIYHDKRIEKLGIKVFA
jgi:hypothetical protein